MRCTHRMLGMGCGNEAESGSSMCADCHAIVFGPLRKDPIFQVVMLILLGFVAICAGAQDKPPQLSADSRIAILKAQLKQKQLESQFLALQQQVANMQQQMTKLQGEYTEGGKVLQDAIDAAYKASKLDKKDWNIDMEKLEYTKVPPPPPPAAPPKAEPPKAKP